MTLHATVGASVLHGSELVRRARLRDEDAWSALYDQYSPLLYRYAYARLRSPEDAEDIAAQVFVEALKGIERFEERGRPILAWLYRIAHNLVVERIRREQMSRRVGLAAQPTPAYLGSEMSVDNIDLLEALGRLKREQQDVIILRFFLQMTSKEVASAIGKTEPAVYSLQARGVAALKRRLAAPPEAAAVRRFPAPVPQA